MLHNLNTEKEIERIWQYFILFRGICLVSNPQCTTINYGNLYTATIIKISSLNNQLEEEEEHNFPQK